MSYRCRPRLNKRVIATLFGTALLITGQAQADFTGDKKLACEAVLCLSSGKRPDECSPSIQKYLSIKFKKAWKTTAKRKEFLEMCPQGDVQATPEQMEQALQSLGFQAEDDDDADE